MLPKIDSPKYKLILPISKIEVSYRPYLTKEKKLLMLALEEQEETKSAAIEAATKQVINNCTLNDVDIDSLPLIDIEYYFYQISARSSSETVVQNYICKYTLEDGNECGGKLVAEFNLLDLKVQEGTYSDNIQITDSIGVKMKYPEYQVVEKIKHNNSFTDTVFELIANCIEFIYEDDQIHYAKDSTTEEIVSFLESLNDSQFLKIENFFYSLPSIKKDTQVICPKCGAKHDITMEGLESFFI